MSDPTPAPAPLDEALGKIAHDAYYGELPPELAWGTEHDRIHWTRAVAAVRAALQPPAAAEAAQAGEARRHLERLASRMTHTGACSIGAIALQGQRCSCGLDAALAFLATPPTSPGGAG